MESTEVNPESIPDLPADIAGPEDFVSLITVLKILAVMLLVVGALTGIVVYLVRKKMNQVSQPVVLRPREEAVRALDAVERGLEGLTISRVALELSAIIKRFLSREFQLNLESQTTDESWNSVDEWSERIPGEMIDPIAQFLQWCDAYKFQHPEDSDSEKRQLLEHAKMIVQRTRPPVPA